MNGDAVIQYAFKHNLVRAPVTARDLTRALDLLPLTPLSIGQDISHALQGYEAETDDPLCLTKDDYAGLLSVIEDALPDSLFEPHALHDLLDADIELPHLNDPLPLLKDSLCFSDSVAVSTWCPSAILPKLECLPIPTDIQTACSSLEQSLPNIDHLLDIKPCATRKQLQDMEDTVSQLLTDVDVEELLDEEVSLCLSASLPTFNPPFPSGTYSIKPQISLQDSLTTPETLPLPITARNQHSIRLPIETLTEREALPSLKPCSSAPSTVPLSSVDASTLLSSTSERFHPEVLYAQNHSQAEHRHLVPGDSTSSASLATPAVDDYKLEVNMDDRTTKDDSSTTLIDIDQGMEDGSLLVEHLMEIDSPASLKVPEACTNQEQMDNRALISQQNEHVLGQLLLRRHHHQLQKEPTVIRKNSTMSAFLSFRGRQDKSPVPVLPVQMDILNRKAKPSKAYVHPKLSAPSDLQSVKVLSSHRLSQMTDLTSWLYDFALDLVDPPDMENCDPLLILNPDLVINTDASILFYKLSAVPQNEKALFECLYNFSGAFTSQLLVIELYDIHHATPLSLEGAFQASFQNFRNLTKSLSLTIKLAYAPYDSAVEARKYVDALRASSTWISERDWLEKPASNDTIFLIANIPNMHFFLAQAILSRGDLDTLKGMPSEERCILLRDLLPEYSLKQFELVISGVDDSV